MSSSLLRSKAAFLLHYPADQALRREINDGLKVVEQGNFADDFIFFTRQGERSRAKCRHAAHLSRILYASR